MTFSAELSLHAQDRPAVSLSSLMANSLVNSGGVLCKLYQRVRISTSTVPDGDAAGTYNEVFLGRIDEWSISGGTLRLSGRDETGRLLDRLVETETEYGDDDPAGASANELQEIIQNILDDHFNTASDISGTASADRDTKLSGRTTDGSPVQLYSTTGDSATPWKAADDTGWSLRRFLATKDTVWAWISRLAGMIGWKLRYRWHSGSGVDAFVLVLEEPDRTSPSSVITLDPTKGQCRIASTGLKIQGIRNVWRVGYMLNGGEDQSETASDATSITANGRRVAEAQEGSASQVDTSTEAQAMADNLLSDTATPVATVQVDVPYLWYLELNDMVTLKADGINFDSDQSLIVIGRSNTISQGGAAMTRLTLQGTLEKGRTRPAQRTYENPRRGPAYAFSLMASGGGMLANSNFSDSGNE
ncbi:MAG: hypothetical protein GWO40_05575 [Gammaproteobacteria bacterium]|nr:hypothetical protein [Gammaproteobacteria bacterium]NIV51090.1 hypothetical protein [Gammaproteobacteria bacterium]NIX85033.1 hypothetical protein [Gammaproteobacteria bacterium]